MSRAANLRAVGIILFSMIVTFPMSARAAERLPVWTHTASACSIDESSLAKYAFSGADFTFKGSNISDTAPTIPTSYVPITVRCNVVNPLDSGNPDWNTLIVGYNDPDGTATNHRVTVRLRRLSRPTGLYATMVTFISNNFATIGRTENSVQFSYPFDFLHNEYYVEIDLIRPNTLGNPVAYMVRIGYTDTTQPPR